VNTLPLRRLWLSALLGLLVAGCAAMQGRKPKLDSSAGMFKKAEVNYRIETARIEQGGGHDPQARLIREVCPHLLGPVREDRRNVPLIQRLRGRRGSS